MNNYKKTPSSTFLPNKNISSTTTHSIWQRAICYFACASFVFSNTAAAASIVIDGRTNTQISIHKTVTDITTQTVQGVNGFNSFQKFNIGSGKTVNLHLPNGTANLLNLVHAQRSELNGVLNAFKGGAIGGNVFFLNPHGIVVGSEGVLNAGSLSLSTPTPAFIDSVISPVGLVNTNAVNQLLSGNIPLSATGLISVKGRINALSEADLSAGRVFVDASGQILVGAQARVAIADLVNLDGVASAAELVVDNGVVKIVAAKDIQIAGLVSVDGVNGVDAGTIDLQAAGDIDLLSGADISADGQGLASSGGRVISYAMADSTLENGAAVTANSGVTGDGGFVEFSAKDTVNLLGGQLDARAENGRAGTVLIDPTDLNWQGSGNDVFSGGANYQIEATNNIVLDDVYLSTRKVADTDNNRTNIVAAPSTGDSGSITIKAANITLQNGSHILAHADSGRTAGDVSILASDINAFGAIRTAESTLKIEDSTILGRNIKLSSNADSSLIASLLEQNSSLTQEDAESQYLSEIDDLSDGPGGDKLAIKTQATAKTQLYGATVNASGNLEIAAFAGARSGFEKIAIAEVLITDFVPGTPATKVNLLTGENINIDSTSSTSLKYKVLGGLLEISDQSWLPDPEGEDIQLLDDELFDFNSVPLVALSTSKATTTVSGGSVLQASDTLSIKSEALSAAKPTFASPLLFSAAWGEAETAAKTLIDGTSKISATNKATITASSEVELDVTATVNSTNKPIDATFVMAKNVTTTSAIVADNTVTSAGELELSAATKTEIKAGAISKNAGGSGVGIAVAINDSTTTTTATLGGDVTTTSGDVLVASTVEVDQNDTSASASTLGNPNTLSAKITNATAKMKGKIAGSILTATGKVSQANADKLTGFLFPGIKEGKFNASGAVAYADSHNTATANIAANAKVKAEGNIDVKAKITDRPSASVAAKSNSTGTAIGGSVVHANFSNNANAYIGKLATVDAKKALNVDAQTHIPYPWEINWDSSEDILNHLKGDVLDLALTSYAINSASGKSGLGLAVGVNLFGLDNNSSAYIDEGAQVNSEYSNALLPALDLSLQSVTVSAKNEVNSVNAAGILSKKFLGSSGGKAAVGGAANFLDITGSAVAGIRDNASVQAEQAVNVKAETLNQLVTVTEAGGKSDKVGIEGASSLNTINNTTTAYVDDKANINTGSDLNVDALSNIEIISVAGGVVATKGPVGIGMSVSLNTVDSNVSAYIGNHDPVNDLAAGTGEITAGGDVNVVAKAETEVGAYSIAGALATNSSAQTSAPAGSGETQDGSSSAAGSGGTGAAKGKFGIAMSGDASLNEITANTYAYIADGVTLKQANDVKVDASNELDINALSGAVTVSLQAEGNGLSGSYAQNTMAGKTHAYIDNASVSQSGDLKINSGVDGKIKTLSASVAGTKGKAGVAGSVSINKTNNETQAYLHNSSISGVNKVNVQAEDKSIIQSIAGALAFGGKAGVGLSFAWNELANDVWAFISDSDVDAASTVTVDATTDNSIDSITAAIGASKETMAAAASVSINTISNTTTAYISGKKSAAGIDAGNGVLVNAQDDSDIFAIAGSLGASAGKVGVGASVAWSETSNIVDASIENSADIDNASGDVTVQASSDSQIEAIAAAGGIAGKAAISGSFSAVQTNNTVKANVKNLAQINTAGKLTVSAEDTAGIRSIAGNVALSSGQVALGVSAAYNVIDNTSEASIDTATVSASDVLVEATEDADIESLAVAGGASSKVAVAGSLAINKINNVTKASAKNATLLTISNDIYIHAKDASGIASGSGGISGSGSVAVGVAGSYNTIGGSTTAAVSGGNLQSDNVRIKSEHTGSLEAIAVSGAISGRGAGAGSVAINTIKGTTDAYVNDGAQILAQNNVGVIAESDEQITIAAGSLGVGIAGAGLGVSMAVNHIKGTTASYIDDASVTGLAKDSADSLSLNSGELISGIDLAQQVDVATYGKLDLKNNKAKESVTGVAVNASSSEHVENISANISGGGYAGIGLVESINVIGGSTQAYVLNADINQSNSGAGSGQDVAIKASNIAYANSFVGNLAVGGVAGSVGEDLHTISRTTRAYAAGGRIYALDNVSVNAIGLQGVSSVAVGGSVGGLAGAGTLSMALLTNTTEAYFDSTRLQAASLDVAASNTNNMYLLAGAVAIGGDAAGGAFSVGSSDSITRATIRNANGVNRIDVSGDVNVAANNETDIHHIVVSGAGGGGNGIAGMADVNLVTDTTEATIENSDLGLLADRVGAVHVKAEHTLDIDSKAGALGVGISGGGVGAGASVNIVKARTVATLVDSNIYSNALTDVIATSVKHIDATALTAGVGGTVGIGGAAVVTLIGDDVSGDSADEVDKDGNGSLSAVNTFASGDRFGNMPDTGGGEGLSTADQAELNAATQKSTAGVTGSAGGYLFRTAAEVSGNNIVNAGSFGVLATDKVDTKTLVGGFGASLGGGIGGAVAVTTVKANVAANVAGTALTTNGNVNIAARADKDIGETIDVLAIAGGAGIVGLGAAVSYTDINNHVDANLISGVDAGVGSVTVIAEDNTSVISDAKGAAAGAAAAGIVVSRAKKSSDVNAQLAGTVTAAAATVSASETGRVKAVGQSAAAGLLASGSGAFVTATDASNITAKTGDNATFHLGLGALSLSAKATPQTEAQADGVAVSGGAAIGASIGEAKVDTQLQALLGASNTVNSGGLSLLAQLLRNGGHDSAKSTAFAASGGFLFGGSATTSDADAVVQLDSRVGNNSTLNLGAGALTLNTSVDSKQYSKASGINGGFVAAGFNEANATSDSTINASLGSDVKVAAGSLAINAGGSDNNFAESIAGSGGVYSGSASVANTSTKSTTKAYVDSSSAGRDIAVDDFSLIADHSSEFNSSVDSTNASVLGASGAYAHNKVDNSVVWVGIGQGVEINADSVVLNANNRVRKPVVSGFNVVSASGGVFDAAATHSDTTVYNDTDIVIADDVTISTYPAGATLGTLSMTALNDVELYDAAKMDSGGAVAIARAESYIYNTQNDADITLGSGSALISDNDIHLEATTRAIADTEVQTKTYGLAGAAEGRTISSIGASNNITLNGARIESDEDVTLQAGYNNVLVADAETRLWNKTAVPIETDPDADGSIVQDNRIAINAYVPSVGSTPTGSTAVEQIDRAAIATVKDVYLQAGEGSHTTRGYGRGTDLYRQLLEDAAELFGSNLSLDITGGSVFDNSQSGVKVDGTVFAGTHFHQFLHIDEAGLITKQSEGVATPGRRYGVDLARNIDERITALQDLYDEYKDDNPDIANGFKADIDILEAKKAQLGVGASADFIDIAPIAAYTGKIITTGDSLSGAGELIAPGDTRIEIINQSESFLNIGAVGDLPSLYIPDDLGGIVSLNGVRVSSKAEIDAINQHGVSSGFNAGQILDRQTSDAPVILVRNTYEDPVDLDALNPEIHIDGDISNLRGLVKIDSAGTIQIASKVYAKTIDIKTKGDFIQLFTVGFTHTGGDPTFNIGNNRPSEPAEVWRTVRNRFTGALETVLVPYTLDFYFEDVAEGEYPNTSYNSSSGWSSKTYSDTAVLNAESSTIAGNSVFISGEKLNINSLIQSGLSTFNLNISQAKANEAVAAPGDWIALDMMENGQLLDPLFQPKIRYLNGQIELQSLAVGGGYMQLYGDIFSTGNGRLKVLDGYGRITVNNSSGYNLALNRLDTGPGVAGTIKITDTSTKYLGEPLITTITRIGDAISTTFENMNGGDSRHPTVQTFTSRTAEYNPRAGRRLHWFDGEKYDLYRWETYTKSCFGDCDLGPIGDWLSSDPGDVSGSDKTFSVNPRPYGGWLADDSASRTNSYILDFKKYRSTTSDTGTYYVNTTRSGLAGVNENIHSKREWRWSEYYYYDHSLYASMPIAIEFTGYDTGLLSVNAGAHDLSLKGAVRNLTGSTNFIGNNISSADAVIIQAKALNLTANAGSIGVNSLTPNLSDYIKINLQPDGELDASATAGITVWEQDGDLAIKRAQGNGIVHIMADGDLFNVATGVAVTGSSIRLTSENGKIGSVTPMLVDVTSATGNLGAFAARSIDITENEGDLRLDSVRTLAGDVSLIANNGSIIDDNSIARVDVETRAQLLAVADRAGLRGASAVASEENTVQGYNLAKQQDYARYWQLRNVQADGSADAYDMAYSFKLGAEEVTELKTNQGWSDTQLSQYEARQTLQYHRAHQEFGTASYDDGFSYDVAAQDNATYQELIAGSTWTDEQITNRVAAGIFKDVADTEVLIEEENIISQNITLSAVAGGIGTEQGARVISFLDPSSWTDEERLALVAADRKDVDIDYVNKTATVRQKDDVDITLLNAGVLVATAASDIYIGSEEDIRVKQVDAAVNKDVRIKTGAALINVAVAGSAAINGRDITVEAGGADLGASATPFYINARGGTTARAKGDLYLSNTVGDMRLEQVFAGNMAKLVSVGAIVEDPFNYNLLTDLRANKIWLTAATTIGERDVTGLKHLDIGSDPTGWVDMTAPDGIYIYSPSLRLNLRSVSASNGEIHGTSFSNSFDVIGDVSAKNGIALTAGEAIILDGNGALTSAEGDIELTSSGYRVETSNDPLVQVDSSQYGLKMAETSFINALLGEVSLLTVNDMLLAQLSSPGNVGAESTAGSLNIAGAITSDGEINLTAANDLNFTGGSAIAAQAITLVGGSDGSGSVNIGPVASGVYTVDTPSTLEITAADFINVGGNIRGGSSVKLTSGKGVSMNGGSIYTDGLLDIASGDTVTVDGELFGGTGVRLSSGNDVVFAGGSIESDSDVTLVAGTDGSGSIFGSATNGTDIKTYGVLTLQAADAIGAGSPLELQVAGIARFLSTSLDVDVSTIPTSNPLVLAVSAIDGGPAANVKMKLHSESSVNFETFNVGIAEIEANTPLLTVPEGKITNYSSFKLPAYSARIDTASRAAHEGYDVNAFTLDGDFSLNALPESVDVDAFILYRNPRQRVAGNPRGVLVDIVDNILQTQTTAADRNASGLIEMLSGSPGFDLFRNNGESGLVDVSTDWLGNYAQ